MRANTPLNNCAHVEALIVIVCFRCIAIIFGVQMHVRVAYTIEQQRDQPIKWLWMAMDSIYIEYAEGFFSPYSAVVCWLAHEKRRQ